MTSKEIEQRIIEEVCKYTATCKRLRRASVDEADARRSSLSMVDILVVATERARLESLAYEAEGWLFTLSKMLIEERQREKEEEEAKRLGKGAE
jgi:hypothetical protein